MNNTFLNSLLVGIVLLMGIPAAAQQVNKKDSTMLRQIFDMALLEEKLRLAGRPVQ